MNDLFIMLAMHVPAHDNRDPDVGFYVKPAGGQRELYDIVTQHKARTLALLHGHFHCGLRGWDDHGPLQEISFPSALYNMDRQIEKKQAPGYNVPEFRPGFTLLSIGKDGMALRYKPVGVTASQDRLCPLAQWHGSAQLR